jgi:DNA mismatch repair protein MutL
MGKIQTLSKDVINHIAAGEVVERPASVLKELIENAIDSGASKITVSVRDGGIKKVEVADDGSGISEDDLDIAVESHSTSKISGIDDLSKIETLGFRGEALASITAVSKTEIITATDDEAGARALAVDGGEKGNIEQRSRDRGTTVTVTDLFYNVPARRKFLKTPSTEYRKIIETFYPIVLVHPEIHFVLESNGKVVKNLPAVQDASSGTLHPQRVGELFPDLDLVELFYDGNGITVGGFTAHPSHQRKSTRDRYIFVNGRPIWDSGIAKSASIGMARFIPDGTKVPFFISVTVPFDQVDVNVHPQKSEVRFANPYRIYSAVESAVKRSFEDTLGKVVGKYADSQLSRRFRQDGVVSAGSDEDRQGKQVPRQSRDDHDWSPPPRYDVEKSLAFSKMILEESGDMSMDAGRDDFNQDASQRDEESRDHEFQGRIEVEGEIHAEQFLNRYIVAQIEDALFVIDQHAAAERIRFETLLNDHKDKGIEVQSLMLPVSIALAETEALFVEEMSGIFKELGFDIRVDGETVSLSGIPAILSSGDHEALFRSVLADLQEYDEIGSKKKVLEDEYRDSLIATMACHSSVRMNQRLNQKEAESIVRDLLKCKNSYSCPHGRPIVWKITQEEIDRHFNR